MPPKADREQVVERRGDLPWVVRELVVDEPPEATPEPTEVMYVDLQNGQVPRVMRVALSKSGRSVYVDGRRFLRTGGGYKYNFVATDDRSSAWISRPRRDGLDALYPQVVMVDEDVRDEYWSAICGRPEHAGQAEFKRPGKYTKRGRGKRQSGPEKGAGR